MALGVTIVQLLMELLHEAPVLIEDGKRLFHAVANDSPDGLQKVVNTAEALSVLADHAREAAVLATGNPARLPEPQPLPATAATDSVQVGADPKPAIDPKDAEIADLKAQLAALKPPIDTGSTL